MKNIYYTYIIIVLVYRNYEDLEECLQSFMQTFTCAYKCIVVNAFYDDDSKKTIEEIAHKHSADFLNKENNGYGYGNNEGINYATKLYDYDYMIISNPDVIVKKFDGNSLKPGNVYAPIITTATGKKQNPFLVTKNKISAFLEYCGYKRNVKLLIYMGIAINKLLREFVIYVNKYKEMKIFAAHGSFVILARDVIENLGRVYDENIFLFGEEVVMAYKLDKLGIATNLIGDIEIFHKEDGSMKLADFSMYNQCRKSNLYIYDNYIRKRNCNVST